MKILLVLLLSITGVTGNFVGTLNLLNGDSKLYVCNDGSPAGYYWQAATNSSMTNRWLIFLMGGGWCYDQASCASRYQSSPTLMSSKGWSTTITKDGIFASSYWSGSNIAYLGYCSSDAWIGNRTSSTDTFGWYFNGRNIVKGVIDDLFASKGLKSSTEILIAGCSAGGRGVIHNLDWVTAYIRQQLPNPSATKIKGFMDSAWWIEGFPSYPGTNPTTFIQQTREAFSLANMTPAQGCAAVFPTSQWWQCMFGANVWPHLKTDHAWALFETDEYQLTTNAPGVFPWADNPTLNSDQTLYALQFSNITKFTITPPLQSGYAIFSPACYSHCSTESNNWFSIKINGINQDQAIASWFFQDKNFQLVDTCPTFNCGQGCPGVPTS